MNTKRVLILAPHTDDGELGCGATVSKLIREGAEVWYAAFSKCEESLPPGCPADTLVHEVKNATKELGIKEENVIVFDYKVRHFSEMRQRILDDIIVLGQRINPDTVFLPSMHDIHQDHTTISNEGIRAFKKKTLLAYELPWNNLSFNNQAFFAVSHEDAIKKVKALQMYKSQSGRQYAREENILAVLRTHGMQIGVEYAEVFEVPRIIL